MELRAFLEYCHTSAGINAVIGFVLSFVVEWFPTYTGLPSKTKRLVMLGLCLVVPVLSLVGLVLIGVSSFNQDAVWAAVLAGFTAFLGSQVAQARQLTDESG